MGKQSKKRQHRRSRREAAGFLFGRIHGGLSWLVRHGREILFANFGLYTISMVVIFYEVFMRPRKGNSEFDAMGDGLAALAFLIFLPVSLGILLLLRFGALRLAKRGFLYLPAVFIGLSVAFSLLMAGLLLSS